MNLQWTSHFLVAILLASCADGGTKPVEPTIDDDTNVGAFYLENGQTAVNATVTVYPTGGTDSLPSLRTRTNAKGLPVLAPLPEGLYSLVVTDGSGRAVFVDSAYSDGAILKVRSDTLKPTGSIKGRIKVQAGDSPKGIRVALAGEGGFRSTSDDSGFFTLSGVPHGQHTLVLQPNLESYVNTSRRANVFPGSITDLGNIDLYHTRWADVTGIVGIWDSLGGAVTLRWDPSFSPKLKGYKVYRSLNENLAVERLLQTVDPGRSSIIDTLFQREPGERDRLSADSTFVHYRVTAIGTDGTETTRSNFWSKTIRRPFLVSQLPASWKQISSTLPNYAFRLDTLGGGLLAFGTDDNRTTNVWNLKDDGAEWKSMLSEAMPAGNTMGLSKSVVHRGELCWVKPVPSRRTAPPPSWSYGPDQMLLDSLRILRLDGSGKVDSITLPAANDSVSYAILLLDSAGLVLVEGKIGYQSGTGVPYFIPTHRRWEAKKGTWTPGNWASWYKLAFDPVLQTFVPTIRTLSLAGKAVVHAPGAPEALLDLDTLTLAAKGSLAYARPSAPDRWSKVQGGPANLTGLTWKSGSVYALGEGEVWRVTFP